MHARVSAATTEVPLEIVSSYCARYMRCNTLVTETYFFPAQGQKNNIESEEQARDPATGTIFCVIKNK